MFTLNMSLFYVVSNKFILWQEVYECPIERRNSRFERPLLGSFFLAFGVLFIILYIPCLIVIIGKKSRAPVYLLMLALAIFDILSLIVDSICTGIFDILGISFCNYPLPIFILGAIGGGSWMAGSLACILLAIERCAEINQQFPLEFLFRKSVFPVVAFLLLSYTIYAFFFTKALVFSAEASCWFFDPMIGKDASLYHSYPHSINNFAVGICTIILYLYLSYRLIFKFGYSTSMWLYKTKRQIIFQAISLCIFHATAAFIYEYMQFFAPTPLLIIISQFVWQWSSGAICLAYLVFNRTIRNLVVKMILPKKIRLKYGLYIGVDEHIAFEGAVGNTGAAVVNAAGAAIKLDNFIN
ncbi:Serpentine Receptor, class T [Caenorhabditis elegans]|uniref:Serpentine Receptor, class T n=1 Tax=Caenorhabditis elegans TaxID=6239 RepID=Q9XU64_CAEEL|nr:Serpentine Receptor, class T [Caenorhabditis elegans]CAB05638.2 Serpentine Receptor, class T [Caenorhabditis elegans]|eukprot:NP_497070.2 Serpentine Receptor, class T [Caenorhabditis elegans]